jgi:uncharacterized protein (DUF362 family)
LPDDSLNHQEENQVYAAVRQSLYLSGLDTEHFGTEMWNPLGEYIQPGSRVLLKPNFVFHEYNEATKDCMVTHGAVIRAVLDYVYRAGGPTGRIVIADAPEQVAEFDRILEQTGVSEIIAFYQKRLNYTVELHDLRTIASDWDGKTGFFPPARELSGDPLGYAAVDLGTDSELEAITRDGTRFGIAAYSLDALQERHRPGRHEYLVSRIVLDADVVINLPKMKTHQKAGLTGGLKNLVGINGCKDWLPHYRMGSPSAGGDEYPDGAWLVGASRATKGMLLRRSRILWGIARKGWHILRQFGSKSAQLPSGAWHGNDTVWRMALDLNKILLFADRDGRMSTTKQRQTFCIMDGVIAGQGDGPLAPIAKPAGVVLASRDGAAVDAVVAQLMGYDWCKLGLLARFLQPPGKYWFTEFDGDDVRVATDSGIMSFTQLPSMDFIPPPGWVNHVERRIK